MVSWCVVVLTAALISVFVLSAPANAGVSPEDGRGIYPGDSVIIGETNLKFYNATGPISEGVILSNWADSHIVIPFSVSFDSSRHEDELLPGEYIIRVVDKGGNVTIESYIYFVSPKLDITTEVNKEEFGWVTRGDNITFEADTNLWIIAGNKSNYITYKLLEPRGNDISISNIDVGGDGLHTLPIDTAGMRTGVYTLSIETDPGTNNGLDTEGTEISFEVRSKGVTIEADKEKQTVTEDIVFTVFTTPHTNITVNVTWGRVSQVTFGAGGHYDSGPSDEEGKFITSASFADTGSYEITATEDIMNTTDSIFAEIVQYEAEVNVDKDPPIYHIGKNVKITGSSTAGDRITLKIDDEVVATGLDVEGFDYTWKTENLAPDSYKVAIWVLPFSNPFQDPPDASVSIVLIRGGLFVEPSADFVALGDDFTIEGIVPGRDRVDIFTIAPDGGGGRGFDHDDIWEDTAHNLSASGLAFETTGVDTDGEYETEKIAVSKDVDTGTYLIAVLNYGRDGVWGKSGSDDLLKVISNDYSIALAVKTTDQILAILKDKTINAAGSDDLMGIATIKVEKGFVTLDDIDAVALNEEIKVTGTTNRQVGTSIIVTVEGLDEKTPKLKPKIKEVVEDPDNFYNKFEISFATASANIGAYEVTADDGDGHVAITTMNILLAVEPSVNVSATSTPTPIVEPEGKNESEGAAAATPLQTPTTASIETETEKQPGFEPVFSIAVLLVVTWLMLRTRRQRQRQRKDKKR